MADTVTDAQDVLDEATTGEVVEPSAGQQPETLTLAQLEARLTDQKRYFQSQLDKRTAAIVKQLKTQDQVKALAEKHKLTPEALAELQGAFTNGDEAQTAEDEAEKPDRQMSAGPTDEQVNTAAKNLYERYGITGDDPEVALIDTTGTAQDFLDSIIYAGRTRKARLQQAQGQRRSPARAPALAPAGGRAQERAYGKGKSELLEAEVNAMFDK